VLRAEYRAGGNQIMKSVVEKGRDIDFDFAVLA
jgi:hypothetical protein